MSAPSIKQVVLWLVVIFLFYAVFTSPVQTTQMLGIGWDIIINGMRNVIGLFNSVINR